jgi:type I restriction enzyme S subunit
MKVQTRSVSEIADQIRGVTYGKQDATKENRAGYLPVLRAGNITEDGLTYDDLVYVPSGKISDKQRIRKNDIVIAASSGSLDVVGKAARALNEFDGGFGAFCKVLRPRKEVNATYFFHYFKTPEYRKIISSLAAGANINNLRNGDLDDLQIPLPPLDEQKRIAAILDAADALRAKRRQSIAQLDALLQSTFLDLFGDPVTNPMGWDDSTLLSNMAEIVSGVTKGRKLNGKNAREIPYLAVANVQDKHLKLDAVKSIEATDEEIEKYRLLKNDLLLTEGGDPDKLGRGSLWNDGLPVCIHQNHIFRVRIISTNIIPIYLNWLIGSQRGKKYFLRSAKQTTGIASINMTQLKAFPMLTPPLPLQQKFAAIVESIERQKTTQRAHLAELDALFAALQHRAFRGEL